MKTENEIQNAPERPEYSGVLIALRDTLFNLPPVIVAIDGAPGVGKTTLGRFLAWRFNTTLIETDLFLLQGKGRYEYRLEELGNVIESRMDSRRPAIVDGVVALRIIKDLKMSSQFHIHVKSADVVPPGTDDWHSYVNDFSPEANAHLVLSLPVVD